MLTMKEIRNTFRDFDLASIKQNIHWGKHMVEAWMCLKKDFESPYHYDCALRRFKNAEQVLAKNYERLRLLEQFEEFKRENQSNTKSLDELVDLFIFKNYFI